MSKKMTIKEVFSSIGKFADRHSPEILLGIGISGMLTTTILAVKATPKAIKQMDAKKREKNKDKLSVKEVIASTWKYYIPPLITGGLSTVCLIGSNTVNNRRNAALATAYAISESALKTYTEKVIETVGEKKELSIREAVSKERIDDHPVSKSEVIMTQKGNTLCFDAISGRYFKSDMDQIQKVVNDVNLRLRNEMYISLNEFYMDLGLDPVKMGDILGWNIDKGYLEVKFDTQLADDGTPALVMDYRVAPKYDYQ